VSESDSNLPWSRQAAAGPRRWEEPDDVPEDGRLIGMPEPAAKPTPTGETAAPDQSAAAAPARPIVDWSAVPEVQLITAAATEQARVQTEARRWDDLRRILRTLGLVLGVGLALVAGHELLQRIFNARPSEVRFTALGAEVAASLLGELDSPARPLRRDTEEVRLVAQLDSRRADYRLVVTLRLREALYGPADSNGAQAYLDLQGSVAEAHKRVVRERLFLDHPELAAPPQLPVLLDRTHRAGERLVVELPVEARRAWWGWRLEPLTARRRISSPPFSGEILALQPVPHLLFGEASARERMGGLLQAARAYVLAVQHAAATRTREVSFEQPGR
jgi:hypothetical protein